MNATKPFILPRSSPRCVELPDDLTVADVADASRSAALGFAWGADRGWGRHELARWLVGPYARAVAPSNACRSGVRRRRVGGSVDEAHVVDLLKRAHARVLAGLRAIGEWRQDATFARETIDAGFVVGVTDRTSAIGYAPLDALDMRLVDRVRSLFLADFLTRPDDYARFTVCDDCGAATFDGAVSHAATCHAPDTVTLRRRAPRDFRVDSEIVADASLDRYLTLPGIGARYA